jgi:mRNA interferase RelE/StbE
MELNKTWRIVFDNTADKQFSKLDKVAKERINDFLKRTVESENPKATAVQMAGNMSQFWRYRVGDYRIICSFEENELIILLVKIGHRRDVYS